MDDFIAVKLTDLFREKGWKKPFDREPFEVFFNNKTGMKMRFRLSTPEELSQVLKHIIDENHGEIFDRSSSFGAPDPIHVRMYIRDRDEKTQKEHIRQAFVMAFRDIEDPSFVYWQDTPENAYNGPGLSNLIHMLDHCDNDWRNLNFMYKPPRQRLRLVHSAP